MFLTGLQFMTNGLKSLENAMRSAVPQHRQPT